MHSVGSAAPLFEIRVDDEYPAVLSGEDLIEAWGGTVPDLAARALDMRVGANATIFRNPEVVVRRLR